VRRLVLARHGEAASNVDGIVNGVPPGVSLSSGGREEAAALGRALAPERVDLGVATRFARSQETVAIALADRPGLPRIVVPELDEIGFGSFEGGPLAAYREWAWTNEPDAECPGGGESRVEVALRVADALDELLGRSEETILAVGHALPVRYVIDGADGTFPAARIEPLAHATPYVLGRSLVETAAETLRTWAEAPEFRDVSGE
jgi:probable phosphoglycerate mutase